MFLYLEILTMVGLYFESGKLPVRFPLYIAMVAMARYVIVDIKEMDNIRLLGVSASIVLVALAVWSSAMDMCVIPTWKTWRIGKTRHPEKRARD